MCVEEREGVHARASTYNIKQSQATEQQRGVSRWQNRRQSLRPLSAGRRQQRWKDIQEGRTAQYLCDAPAVGRSLQGLWGRATGRGVARLHWTSISGHYGTAPSCGNVPRDATIGIHRRSTRNGRRRTNYTDFTSWNEMLHLAARYGRGGGQPHAYLSLILSASCSHQQSALAALIRRRGEFAF